MLKNGMVECSVCHSKIASPSPRSVSRAYDKHRSKVSSRYRALKFLLVAGDCILVGLQLIFVTKQGRRQKVGEKPLLSISTFVQVDSVCTVPTADRYAGMKKRENKKKEKKRRKIPPVLLFTCSPARPIARGSPQTILPSRSEKDRGHLQSKKEIGKLYFNPATVKMLSNLKVALYINPQLYV
ncbi:hypothetical protein BHE74_00023845 [Ensete ventricosum]|nr:hypothetical protein BHE74_00023845 [Ensete ventricosum]